MIEWLWWAPGIRPGSTHHNDVTCHSLTGLLVTLSLPHHSYFKAPIRRAAILAHFLPLFHGHYSQGSHSFSHP